MGKFVEKEMQNKMPTKAGKIDVSKLATKKELANLAKQIEELEKRIEELVKDLLEKVAGINRAEQ